jgi:hypothetical protein
MKPGVAFLAAALTLCLSFGAASPALAANDEPPQVLGLIATKQPTPLNCVDGTCTGFFSAFCMQEKRPRPTAGQRYDLAGAGDLALIVDQTDGKTATFSGTGLLEFESEGEYTSVKVSLDQRRLASLNAKSVSVIVPRHVALVPRLPEGMANVHEQDDLETPPARAVSPPRVSSSAPTPGPMPRSS